MSKVFRTVAVCEDVTLVHASRGNEMAPLLPPPNCLCDALLCRSLHFCHGLKSQGDRCHGRPGGGVCLGAVARPRGLMGSLEGPARTPRQNSSDSEGTVVSIGMLVS